MSQRDVRNIAASVRQKLLNKSKEQFQPFNEILQYYGLERFLYRLSISKYRDKFILKGALLFTVWRQSAVRSTVDIDLLGKVSNDPAGIVKLFQEICDLQVKEDGLRFESDSVAAEPIALDADYQGVRVQLYGYLDTARIRVQIDIGFSDVITPRSEVSDYPTILDSSVLRLNCYNKETAIAEKLQAMVKLDIINSRMKDIYDLWILLKRFEFDGTILMNAITNTFKRRETEITANVITFTEQYYHNEEKIAQWNGFLKRSKLSDIPTDLEEVIGSVKIFLLSVLTYIEQDKEFRKIWKPELSMWQ